jgi:energy-coupling factor transporter ATP-binding protein EcfA2
MKEITNKNGICYRINKGEERELFQAFAIITDSICKYQKQGEEQLNIFLACIEEREETYTLVADSGYGKKALVNIAKGYMPSELVGSIKWIDSKAMLDIQQIGTKDIFVYPYNHISNGVEPIDYNKLGFPNNKEMESKRFTLASPKEGETSEGTGGVQFNMQRKIIEDFIGYAINPKSLELLVNMNISVFRHEQPELRKSFVIGAYRPNCFTSLWILPAIKIIDVKLLEAEEKQALAAMGIVAGKDGKIEVSEEQLDRARDQSKSARKQAA